MPPGRNMAAPLFILSFRHRDELNRLAERGGWRPIAARRADDAEARFAGSGAAVAVVDARGALDEGLEAVRRSPTRPRRTARPCWSCCRATTARRSTASTGSARPISWSARSPRPSSSTRSPSPAAMPSGSARRMRIRRGPARSAPSWRWQPGGREVELSPALAAKAGLDADGPRRIGVLDLLRQLDPEGRRAAAGAVGRARRTGAATAFAHADPGSRPAAGSPIMSGSAQTARSSAGPSSWARTRPASGATR